MLAHTLSESLHLPSPLFFSPFSLLPPPPLYLLSHVCTRPVFQRKCLTGFGVQGSAEALVEGGDTRWALPLGAALLAVRHLGLGGWDPRECLAVENELRSWQKLGCFSKQEPALRSPSPPFSNHVRFRSISSFSYHFCFRSISKAVSKRLCGCPSALLRVGCA